jgi:glycosyltransferase involved in cell wall biosynthesis
VFFGGTAHAAAVVAARTCGDPAARGRISLVLACPHARRLELEGRFPSSGRDSLAEDFLERKAVAGADALACPDSATREWLDRNAWALPPVIEVLPDADAPRPALWRGLLEAGPRIPAPSGAPRVSVCVSFFEKPAYLAEALSSLRSQSVRPHEVIIVDDGSSSPEALAAFDEARLRHEPDGWRFLRQPNQGPASARNLAAREATGDSLLFCDADNRSLPDMVAGMSRALAASGADCVTCAFRAFGDPSAGSGGNPGYVFVPLGACMELGCVENVFGDTNFIVKREVFLRAGGFPEGNRIAGEDWQFLFELARAGGRIEAVPRVCFEYRMHAAGYGRRKGEVAAAEAALAPFLAGADPLWRRIWTHLAGSVRDPRFAECEALRSTGAYLRTRLAESAENLRLTRQHAANLERLRSVLEKRVRDLDEQCGHLTETVHLRDARGRYLEDKIAAVTGSFSWRATAPLRYLRRRFLDPRVPPAAAPVPAPAAPPAPRFAYSVDHPRRWTLDPKPVTLVGWCYRPEGPALTGIRAVLTGRTVQGTYGLKRNDVLAAAPGKPQAEYCGWTLDLDLVPADKLLDLEVADESGQWHRFFHTGLWVGEGMGPPDLTEYDEWVKVYDSPDREALEIQAGQAAALAWQPLVSVVMPVYDPAEELLARAVDSVLRQTYTHWELCIADDASPSPGIRTLLERISRRDPRIRVTFRERNGHISAASNSALALATGDFVAFLDHDDELAPNALHEVAALLNAHPDTDWIYSDEDKIDGKGRRHDPYFKPDFLPDLFLSQFYPSHLTVYRTAVVRAAGGLREGFEGSQDWDLALRVSEATDPSRIRHIPRILYHWRAIAGSTALRADEKAYPRETANRALAGHFERVGKSVRIHPAGGIHWRVQYPLPSHPPLVSLIIPTRDGLDLLRPCIESILEKTIYPAFELLIVDNGSCDPDVLRYLRSMSEGAHPRLGAGSGRTARVLEFDKPFNYSAMNNFAVLQARGGVLGFLNNDLEVISPGWLEEMTAQALRPEIGCVGAMLYYPNDTIQHAGCVLGIGGVAGHVFKSQPRGAEGRFNRARLAQNYSVLTGACLVVRREVYDRAGGFDEAELAVAFNDMDFCLKVRAAGYRNLWTPFAELYHHESASRGADNTEEKARRFRREAETMMRRWGPALLHDPAYNPNLTLEREDFSIAALPRPARPLDP